METISLTNLHNSLYNGIYLANILNGTTQLIKETCNSLRYVGPAYSHQLGKVLWFKRVSTIENDSVKSKHSIVLMDPYDGSEQTIKIPN